MTLVLSPVNLPRVLKYPIFPAVLGRPWQPWMLCPSGNDLPRDLLSETFSKFFSQSLISIAFAASVCLLDHSPSFGAIWSPRQSYVLSDCKPGWLHHQLDLADMVLSVAFKFFIFGHCCLMLLTLNLFPVQSSYRYHGIIRLSWTTQKI